jgi:pilus assembly protein CpaC
VKLDFVPEILDDGHVSLDVKVEVSAVDELHGVDVAGYRVPSLTMRKAGTKLRLVDGGSFAIAGIYQTTVRERVVRIPIVGHIPIIGMLFRRREKETRETELLIVVRPEVVTESPPPASMPGDSEWEIDRFLDDPGHLPEAWADSLYRWAMQPFWGDPPADGEGDPTGAPVPADIEED